MGEEVDDNGLMIADDGEPELDDEDDEDAVVGGGGSVTDSAGTTTRSATATGGGATMSIRNNGSAAVGAGGKAVEKGLWCCDVILRSCDVIFFIFWVLFRLKFFFSSYSSTLSYLCRG